MAPKTGLTIEDVSRVLNEWQEKQVPDGNLLARIDERVGTILKRIDRIDTCLNEHDDRINTVESDVRVLKPVPEDVRMLTGRVDAMALASAVQRVAWMIVGAVVMFLGYKGITEVAKWIASKP